ncbi:MAG TPA: hypothetical protein VNW46_05745 [Gemmatimonadaceae bacterium]|nr:hypothetical protein [Gemmatimonadaceae bacterium]
MVVAVAITVTRVPTGTTASFRALSAAPDGRSVWATGTGGTVLLSRDGTEWIRDSLPAARSFDLRGVAAVGAGTAYAMVASADTARIYKTTTGGDHWTLQYDDTRRGAFLDGIAFWDRDHGVALGDPIDGAFLLLTTSDGGAHWGRVPSSALPAHLSGEAAFAASNTALVVGPAGVAWFATGGGPRARVYRTDDAGQHWSVADLPIPAGDASSGAFSLAFRDARHGLAVGGDYTAPDSSRPNVARTDDGGRSWVVGDSARVLPYVSAVAAVGGDTAVATGPRGTFLSVDWGRSWQRVDSVSYNAIIVTRGRAVMVGPHGSAAVLSVH